MHDDGGRLWLEDASDGRTLRWAPVAASRQPPIAVPVADAPTGAGTLPPGFLADRLGPVLAPRALVVHGVLDLERRRWRIVDADGNVLVRVEVDHVRPVGSDGGTSDDRATAVRIAELPGGAAAATAIRAVTPDGAEDTDLLMLAAAARDRRPGDYSSRLDLRYGPGCTAAGAVRHILDELHGTVRRNVAGVLDDVDPEFLHDLRVAVRRARSALSQLKGVLPDPATRPLAAELRWLGSTTGPLRDLDVAFLDLDGHRKLLPPHLRDRLDPVEAHLRRRRGRARGRVVRALRSRRFEALMEAWRDAAAGASGDATDPTAGDLPVATVASKRIRKAWKRIVRRGTALGDDPPAPELHRLRIDAKKLRYLLEFFRSLYPDDVVDPAIKALKKVQDLLGEFNDLAVQRERLLDDAREMLAVGSPPAETLLAMGRLESILEQRQEALRLAFHDRFDPFAADDLPAALDAARRGASP